MSTGQPATSGPAVATRDPTLRPSRGERIGREVRVEEDRFRLVAQQRDLPGVQGGPRGVGREAGVGGEPAAGLVAVAPPRVGDGQEGPVPRPAPAPELPDPRLQSADGLRGAAGAADAAPRVPRPSPTRSGGASATAASARRTAMSGSSVAPSARTQSRARSPWRTVSMRAPNCPSARRRRGDSPRGRPPPGGP